MAQVTNQELTMLQSMNSEYVRMKIALGDMELNKQALLAQIDRMRMEFQRYEEVLIEKYGKDSVINLQTGEVTPKQK